MTIHARQADFVPADQAASLLWLLGQPQLEDYLSFVATKVVGGDAIDCFALAEEWRAANDHYHALEQAEENDADRIRTRPLPAALARRAQALRDDHQFRATYDVVHTDIEMVELDRLIVWQLQIDDRYALSRAAHLGRTPGPAALFDFCLQPRDAGPPFTVRRLAADHYQFVSDATDFDARDPRLLPPDMLATLAGHAPLSAALAVPIGAGANFLSAIRSDNRLLLHNGYHRAYALRALGIKYAPCIVQTVTRRDELRYLADPRVAEDPGFYYRAGRPPMLRDYFDPRFAKRLCVYPIQAVVDVRVTVSTTLSTLLPAGGQA
ncbi:hypothetical protein [Sphingomonas sp.]|uniref:hypothetical protein n=1 Tax=Sphingomonas sp. TaxID=28214 RepID=UPI001D3FC48E|nr:hypothetical protein [Sphingomonas sp.]MBX9796963.1 hypothetical protein [Sphingomonas sp.]